MLDYDSLLAKPIEWVGQPLRRREDELLVRGAGTFVDDLMPANCAYLEFVRSPLATGMLSGLDLDAARSVPGVIAILTGADVRSLEGLSVNPLIADLNVPRVPFLAETSIAATGQPLAAVIAESREAARDAADLIAPEISPCQPIDHAPAFAQSWIEGDVATAFDRASHVVSVRVTHSRLAPAPLEPRAALATVNDKGGLTVWLSTQTPHRARTEIARILGLQESDVRVIAPDVGGSFGGKASIYPEDVVVALAARLLSRPVKWCSTRCDEFLSATHGRGAVSDGKLALSADGEFLALSARFGFSLGHRLPYSAVAPANNAGRIMPGPYRIASVDVTTSGSVTNDSAMNIYRGAGRPEAAMLLERLTDEAARQLSIDPVALRRRNIVRAEEFPRRGPTGETLDSGDFETLLDRAGQLAGYRSLCDRRDKRRAAGEICGVGVALYVEPCGAGWESARVFLDDHGQVVVATGSSNQGQGRTTTYAQIVADVLSLTPDKIVVLHGDTATSPAGIGALASRSTAIGGSAVRKAAEAFRENARLRAAQLLNTIPAVVDLATHGFFHSREPGEPLGWRALAQAAPQRLEGVFTFETPDEAWSSGCCIAAVAIDRDTGEVAIERLVWVDDAGTIVNPLLKEGQLHGGLAQGVGEALLERLVYAPDGQLMTGSFMDYAMPRAADIPSIEIDSLETPSPLNPLGAKGVGEAGCIGIPAALVNAVVDALAPFGVRHLDMPLTSASVWHAMRATQEAQDQ